MVLTSNTRNQEQSIQLNEEMRNVAEETARVTMGLTSITQRAANEGEVIRTITIVSAIYLPGSFVTVCIQLLSTALLTYPKSVEPNVD